MLYKHTQVGKLMLWVLFALIVIYGLILMRTGFDFSSFSLMLFVFLILVSFVSLTVTVDENYLRIKFGYGIFRKKFLLKDIVSVKAVKNPWYYGWGIRLRLRPTMLIFNVSGFDAVEIMLKNGRIYRVGTDEQQKLERVLLQAIK